MTPEESKEYWARRWQEKLQMKPPHSWVILGIDGRVRPGREDYDGAPGAIFSVSDVKQDERGEYQEIRFRMYSVQPARGVVRVPPLDTWRDGFIDWEGWPPPAEMFPICPGDTALFEEKQHEDLRPQAGGLRGYGHGQTEAERR